MAKIDRHSETWAAIEAELLRCIDGYRDQLEQHHQEWQADEARGAIKAYRSLLELGKDPPQVVPDSGGLDYGIGGDN